jgi:hypothetical protein
LPWLALSRLQLRPERRSCFPCEEYYRPQIARVACVLEKQIAPLGGIPLARAKEHFALIPIAGK